MRSLLNDRVRQVERSFGYGRADTSKSETMTILTTGHRPTIPDSFAERCLKAAGDDVALLDVHERHDRHAKGRSAYARKYRRRA